MYGVGKPGNEWRRRQRDIEFLAWIRIAPLPELMAAGKRVKGENWPMWRKVALARAIDREQRRATVRR